MKRKIWILLFTTLIIIGIISIYANKSIEKELPIGNIEIPFETNIKWNDTSVFYDSITNIWANQTVKYGKSGSKVNAPRILLARFHRQQQLDETNQLLMGMKVWGVSGSAWSLNKMGDYDFTLTILTTILWQFGDKQDILYPKTLDYLLNVLLVEEGNKYRKTAPKTLGLFPETENHILMTEGSRYLKNRWLAKHGNTDKKYNNVENGMEDMLLGELDKMKTKGLIEFNSMPYVGYTITALLNLEAFASDKLRKEAKAVLDYMNISYAIGSYHYQHFPPMRRRYERATWHELTTDYHSVFFKAWMSYLPGSETNFNIGSAKAHALMGAGLSYRPSDKAVELISDKGNGYFIALGHGDKSSPEIYSAGKNFLLSAGGVNRGKISHIVARPITLFINNNATQLKDVFHLAGPSDDFMEWNNTGVHRNFACAAGPVNVPKGHQAILEQENWSIYELSEDLHLAIYSTETLGIMAVFEDENPHELMNSILVANTNIDTLNNSFQFPNGVLIEYDVHAEKNEWVIKSINKNELDRNYDRWPLINGSFN